MVRVLNNGLPQRKAFCGQCLHRGQSGPPLPAIVPASVNWLFNPAHAGAANARIAKTIRAAFDSGLFRRA
jgi:hypothetical protein